MLSAGAPVPRRADHHLRDPVAIAYIDKRHAAEVANPVDPTKQHRVRADIVRTQCATGMCACQITQLLSHLVVFA
jgi:hypothetical protein